MRTEDLDTRKAEIAVGSVLAAIAAIVMVESGRLGVGWGASGPQSGFFPFISGVVMLVTTAIVIVQAARSSRTSLLFDSFDQAREVLKVGGPLVAAVLSVQYLGFYLMTALYMGLFSYWYGRHRWFVALAAAVLLPVALYLSFERGFRISLPKSALYGLMPF